MKDAEQHRFWVIQGMATYLRYTSDSLDDAWAWVLSQQAPSGRFVIVDRDHDYRLVVVA